MDRRRACASLVLLPATARLTHAQIVGRKARIGFVIEPSIDAMIERSLLGSLRQGLRDLGQVEGQHFVLETGSADGRRDRLPAVVEEILKLQLDVLVVAFPAAAVAVKKTGTSVPVVAVGVDNPVETGLAATLARPGGNITGISSWGTELVAKRLQLLRELVPAARRVGILAGREGVLKLEPGRAQWGRTLDIDILLYEAGNLGDSEAAFAAMARDRVAGLVVFADTNTYMNRVRLNELCLRQRLPSVWGGRDFMTGGALASYQSDFPALFKRAATLVDAILKGAKAGEIPFEQATRLELVIDQRAARALRIAVPKALLLAADQVIE